MSNKVKNMRSLLLILFSAISLSVSAQTITVKGNVKDTSGEPVIGASVVEKGNTLLKLMAKKHWLFHT